MPSREPKEKPPTLDFLQTADIFRDRATDAADTLRHLRAFSITRDLSDLDEVFRKPEDLEKAAVSGSRIPSTFPRHMGTWTLSPSSTQLSIPGH